MSFLDFQKFKASILRFKAGIKDYDQNTHVLGDEKLDLGI